GVVLARAPGAADRWRPRARFTLVTAGALAVGDTVEHVQARGDDEAGRFGTDAGDDVAGQARAVLQAAAVAPRPRLRGQQLVQQVAVALLDVYELEPDPLGQLRRGHVMIDQPAQVVVVEKRVIRVNDPAGRLVHDRARVEDGVVEGDQRPAVAVAAGVRQLQADDEVIV